MVNRDFELLSELVSGRSSRLLEDLAALPGADNTAFVELVGSLVRDVETSRGQLSSVIDIQDPLESAVLQRELERYGNTLNVVHEIVSVYRPDFERRLPVGLMHLVFATLHDVVERPLGIQVDPIVHLDPENNYSVQDLAQELAPFFPAAESEKLSGETLNDDETEGVSSSVQQSDNGANHRLPLLMNIPMLDPANAFLAPIFAHEVAHIAADHSLVDKLATLLDADELDQLYATHVGAGSEAQRHRRAANARLNEWLVEELCDAVACLVAGPAFLYAEGSFLPAPKPASFNDHPSAQERIRWALNFLNHIGWSKWLTDTTPNCSDYLKEVASRPTPESEVPYASYVRAAVEANLGAVLSVAQEMLGKWLTPEEFIEQDKFHELCLCLSAELMPSKLGAAPPTLWHVLLAGWASWLGGRDSPAALAEAISNAELNRFLIKTLELVGISQLWGAHVASRT